MESITAGTVRWGEPWLLHISCISEFMTERGREQKWKEKRTCWVQSLLLTLTTDAKIPLSWMQSLCVPSEIHNDNDLKNHPNLLNYLKWKVAKLCGILRNSKMHYKQLTWLNDTWKNIARKMMQRSNIARHGRHTEEDWEKAPSRSFLYINSCIYDRN